jgi:transketolase
MSMQKKIQEKTVDAIRILSVEAITKANSGHPGICLDAAPIGFEVFVDFLNYSFKNPKWDNRDRFVLSAGHGSAFLYTLLHLFSGSVTREDLKNFRQFGSKTPGHPEYGVTDGVEISTGPLGQGIANAVGMAVAEAHLAAVFNREGFPVVDHYTYVLCGDGCLEEGISYEACSFAGTQKLGKLILLYDKNDISIEGSTKDAINEDILARFKMQGWHIEDVENANDLTAIKNAITKAKSVSDKPSIIICKSVIGFGTPLAGTAAVHGSPLSEKDLNLTKDAFGWTEQPFEVPAAVEDYCRRLANEKLKAEEEWNKLFAEYAKKYPELAKEYKAYFGGGYDAQLSSECTSPEATRISGGKVINEIAKKVPNLMSGSADLSPSTKTDIKGVDFFSPENRAGRNIHFGIREHAMAAICNGVAVHGGLKIICSTFFTFCDYMKGAMRMSAIMRLPVMYVLTHDSIGVGEDGPTHQPIEQLAMLRAMPDINVFRPCDYSETVAAFKCALTDNEPTVIVLSRQNLAQYGKGEKADKGGYVVEDCATPDVLLIATGSEVELCVKAKELLEKENVKSRVISLPCVDKFNAQSAEYKNFVIPKNVKARVCVEAASSLGWREFAGDCGEVVAMSTFGLSGNYKTLYSHFGFTPENIKEKALKSISSKKIIIRD